MTRTATIGLPLVLVVVTLATQVMTSDSWAASLGVGLAATIGCLIAVAVNRLLRR